jgi:hypothetical protein
LASSKRRSSIASRTPGQRLRAIAGEAAGRVDHVLEPRADRQAAIVEQKLIDIAQQRIELGPPRRGQRGALVGERTVIGRAASLQMIDRILQRRQLDMGVRASGRGADRLRADRWRGGSVVGEQLGRACDPRRGDPPRASSPREIGRDGIGEVAEALRRRIRIGHAQHQPADRLRQGRAIFQAGIVERREVMEAVVERVIDAAALVLAAEAEIERRAGRDAGDRPNSPSPIPAAPIGRSPPFPPRQRSRRSPACLVERAHADRGALALGALAPVSGSVTSADRLLTRCWKSWLPSAPRSRGHCHRC